ncbi:MAG: TlpA family protein disulfide reductase, partial [Candidatus Kariarchaeaceae archaeon]
MQTTILSRYLPFLLLIFLSLTFTILSTRAISQEKSIGDLAPDFDIVDIYTNTSSKLSDYHGKVIILDLFATWCGPCIAALPQIIRIQNSYNESHLQIISIDVDSAESYSEVMNFALDNSMSWVVTLDESN